MPMNRLRLATLTFAASACLSAPALAGDLYYDRGSIKDAPVAMQPAAGPCYLRGDLGYSWSNDPNITWTQTGGGVFTTNAVGNASLDNSWIGGVGVGCGLFGSRGIRGELMLDYHGDRGVSGNPSGPIGGTLSTSIQTYTGMFNAYYDLGSWGNFVPYVGAGVGFAHHDMDPVSFTTLANRIQGDNQWALAWSLMAGAGYQVSERLIVDFGYRYIDMGSAKSTRVDNLGFVNPPVVVDDITAHEFKIGLRYHFGG